MRHMTKKHTLGKAQDQRKALLRSLATELFVHGEIKTTMARAKAKKAVYITSVRLQNSYLTKKPAATLILLQVKFLKLLRKTKNLHHKQF